MDNLIIVGISTAAGNIFKFIEKYSLYNVLGFAVNREYLTTDTFLGKPVYELESLDSIINKDKDYIFVAIQWNRLNADRRLVYENLKKEGYKFANLISPLACVNGRIEGDNCWITDLSCIDTESIVGNNVFVKVGAFIGDHSVIEDHSFIGARSIIAGGVTIGEQSFVGLGAIVFDNTSVGKKCIVGAATALKRNLPDYSVYKTSSDSYVVKTYDEDVIESKLLFKKNIR